MHLKTYLTRLSRFHSQLAHNIFCVWYNLHVTWSKWNQEISSSRQIRGYKSRWNPQKLFQKRVFVLEQISILWFSFRSGFGGRRLIIQEIRQHFPDHNFLTEESQNPKTPSPYTWIIDPLDGTNNFVFGLPIFCVSVAIAFKEQVLAAAICDPIHDELFSALKGHGTCLNDRRISVRTEDVLEKSMLNTGFYYDRGHDMRRNLRLIEKFLDYPVIGIRRLGSAAHGSQLCRLRPRHRLLGTWFKPLGFCRRAPSGTGSRRLCYDLRKSRGILLGEI